MGSEDDIQRRPANVEQHQQAPDDENPFTYILEKVHNRLLIDD
jgi:hypothetical protein